MNWKLPIPKAAVLVLQERDNEPIHYHELTKEIEGRGVVASSAAALDRCVYSAISRHIRTRGEESWFSRVAGGTYELTPIGLSVTVWEHTAREEDIVRRIADKPDPSRDMMWEEAVGEVFRDKVGVPLHATEVLAEIWERGLRAPRSGKETSRALTNMLAAFAKEKFPIAGGRLIRVKPGTYLLDRSR